MTSCVWEEYEGNHCEQHLDVVLSQSLNRRVIKHAQEDPTEPGMSHVVAVSLLVCGRPVSLTCLPEVKTMFKYFYKHIAWNLGLPRWKMWCTLML